MHLLYHQKQSKHTSTWTRRFHKVVDQVDNEPDTFPFVYIELVECMDTR